MDALRPEVQGFLDRTWPCGSATRLAGDASTRSFFRVEGRDGGSRVVMDYGEPFTGESDDEALARVFLGAGLPVARILASSPEDGCLLLEDLGDRMLEAAILASPEGPGRRLWVERAVLLAAEVANRGTPALFSSGRAGGPALDEERFRFEMDFFLEHWAGGCSEHPLREELARLAATAAETPRRVLCHRDFHSRNLMVLPDETLAMVDIQDARWGPDSYDLASLLRDAYVDLDDDSLDAWIDLYLDRLDRPDDPAGFRRRFHLVASQRMIKALGTFGYQAHVLGRDRYRDAARRTVDRLRVWLADDPGTRELGRRLESAGLLPA